MEACSGFWSTWGQTWAFPQMPELTDHLSRYFRQSRRKKGETMNEYVTRKSELYARARQGLHRVMSHYEKKKPACRPGSTDPWANYTRTPSQAGSQNISAEDFQDTRDPVAPHHWPSLRLTGSSGPQGFLRLRSSWKQPPLGQPQQPHRPGSAGGAVPMPVHPVASLKSRIHAANSECEGRGALAAATAAPESTPTTHPQPPGSSQASALGWGWVCVWVLAPCPQPQTQQQKPLTWAQPSHQHSWWSHRPTSMPRPWPWPWHGPGHSPTRNLDPGCYTSSWDFLCKKTTPHQPWPWSLTSRACKPCRHIITVLHK